VAWHFYWSKWYKNANLFETAVCNDLWLWRTRKHTRTLGKA
jgi:hypothetical protein